MTTGARPDYARLFSSAPARFLVVEADAPRYSIIDATDAYLSSTLTRREEIAGQGVFEVFPDLPGDVRASLDRVVETRAADGACSPVLGDDGEVRLIVHRFEDAASEIASRVKAAFLTNMSHELRTPLNSIIGFSDLLHEDAAELAPSHREHLRYIRESGRHLLRLINDLVDLTRIEAGRVTLLREAAALGPLVAQVRDQLKPQAEAAGVSVVIDVRDDLPRVDADTSRLGQILANLISNGIKFTPRTGMVRITAEPDGDFLAIAVADTGIGIAAGDLPRLFREFEQIGDGRRRRAEGTGLGLALTRALVELHRGTISVDSTPSRGSTFTLRLPIAVVETNALAAEPHGSLLLASESAHTVLLVEDDVLSQKLAHAVLSRRGYIVSVAASLPEARAVLRHIVPTVVVTDIEFPDGGGRRLLEELRGDPRLAGIPVLAMTAHAMDGERDRLLHAGFDAYLSKPIAIDELSRQVEALINARSGRPNK
jgi:signal transduction histidine kinase/CheY-like chemotaxis protein